MTPADATARLLAVPNTPVPGWVWDEARTDKGYEYRTPRAAAVVAGAGLELDVGILACVAASEFPTPYPAYLLAGLHCVINDARALFPDAAGNRAPDAILQRVTRAPAASGYFGRQGGGGTARWCSTYQRPTLRTLEAARLALAGVGAELAQGGRRWVDLKVQDGGVQAGGKLRTPETVLRARYADGWRWVGPRPELDAYVLCVLGKQGVSLDEALAALADGRARWHTASAPATASPSPLPLPRYSSVHDERDPDDHG